jgi:tryptophanyl-tRNA synthetase
LTNQRSNIIPEKGKGKKVESSRPNNLISLLDEIKKLKEKSIKKNN